MFYLIIAAGIK